MTVYDDNPEISIIVPVYNPGEKALLRCLNSLSEQTFPSFEVILIDDGSTDGSSIICDKFCEKDIRFKVIHQKNSGASTARNIGVHNSIGEFICFVDSDDYVKNDYLEFLYDLMKKMKRIYPFAVLKYKLINK